MRFDKETESRTAELLLVDEFIQSNFDLCEILPNLEEFKNLPHMQMDHAGDSRAILLQECVSGVRNLHSKDNPPLKTESVRFLINNILNLTERTDLYGGSKVVLSKRNRENYIREKLWRFVFFNIHAQFDFACATKEEYPQAFATYNLDLLGEEISKMEMYLDDLVNKALKL